MRPAWYDGHLDLACLALEGRDMLMELGSASGGPQPPSVTFPSLERGKVGFANATLFTAPNFNAPFGYKRNDINRAYQLGQRQLKFYKGWETLGLLQIVRSPKDLEETNPQRMKVVVLMEGADPIREPSELSIWFESGLRMIGLAWATGTRYAGGNYTKGPLTPLGENLVDGMEELGMIHDLSHLSDEAANSLLAMTQGPVVASHSNSRSVLGSQVQRHISDPLIRQVSERGGIVGLNLFSKFLIPNGEKNRASIQQTLAHVDHIVEVMGHRRGIALGSDMDGGFGADKLPQGIGQHEDLTLLTDELSSRGWSDRDVLGFVQGNWLDFMKDNLPEPVEESEG